MAAAAVPDWLRPVLDARAVPARRRAARAAWATERPWAELQAGLGAAFRASPTATLDAIRALRAAAPAGDRAVRGRLRLYEGYAVHRAGRPADAASAYADAARDLRAARLPDEATNAALARVDALAAAGRVPAALALAATLGRALRGRRTRPALVLAINHGNALRLAGDAEGAVARYDAASTLATALGDPTRAAVADMNAGVARVEAGDVDAGASRLAAAADAFRGLGLDELEREARSNAAWAAVHAGRIGDGIRALDALARAHRDGGLPRWEALCRLDLADALRRSGDAPSAEREALLAAARFGDAGAVAERAEALWMAAAAAGDVDPRRGLVHARAARRAAATPRREALALRGDLLVADATARAGRPPAPAALARLGTRARALGQRGLAADVALLAGTVALDAGRAADARKAFVTARRLGAARPFAIWAADAGLAALDARRPGGFPAALRRLQRVARFVEEVRAGLPGAWLRARFAADRLDPWLVRVELLLARGRPADRGEAERLLDALAARRFLAARPPRADARTQRIRARLEAIYDRLARGDGPVRGDLGTGAVLERRARTWERALAAGWRRAERQAAAEAAPTRPMGPRASPRGAEVAFVHLWRRDDRVAGLVRVGTDVGARVDLGPVARWDAWASGLRLRAPRWAFLRDADAAATDPSATEGLLGEIAEAVLAPLGVGQWPRDVRFTADPGVPDLPWELLPCRGRRVGDHYDVLRVPAGRVGPATAPRGVGAVVVGVGAPELPGVEREVADVAEALGTDRVLVGAAATRAAVADALATADVVHVAGHGWDAGEAPPLAGVRLADGWFSAADLPTGGVSARLVVLAACRTGRTSGLAGVAWGGLVQALLTRGAHRVVWTLDDVDDRAAAALMATFHRTRRTCDDRRAFGRSLVETAQFTGHPGSVLAFRCSGVCA
ncbi:MAG: CHAT domain-containing protein [Planctomycetia bacterium]|nr:CHAT domain-containing protein [Planctomycetia bacterium]